MLWFCPAFCLRDSNVHDVPFTVPPSKVEISHTKPVLAGLSRDNCVVLGTDSTDCMKHFFTDDNNNNNKDKDDDDSDRIYVCMYVCKYSDLLHCHYSYCLYYLGLYRYVSNNVTNCYYYCCFMRFTSWPKRFGLHVEVNNDMDQIKFMLQSLSWL